MATATHRATTPSTANSASYVSDAFTPTAGDLLVVCAVVSASATATATCTASANGITFTQRAKAAKSASADSVYVLSANELVGASPASMTVTVDTGADAGTGCVIFAFSLSGMTKFGAAAIFQTAVENNGLSGTPVVTFSNATMTTNPVLALCGNGTNPAGLTPPTSFTELGDSGYATPNQGGEYAVRDSGHTSATVTYGSASGTTYGTIGVEFDASATPGRVRELGYAAVHRASTW